MLRGTRMIGLLTVVCAAVLALQLRIVEGRSIIAIILAD